MQEPNARTSVEVTADELPLHCPLPDSSLWNSHPRVYIPLDQTPQASCPYCGTRFHLVREKHGTNERSVPHHPAVDDGNH